LWGTIDFHDMKKILWKVNSAQLFGYKILQNIFFYVPPNKEIHKGFEQLEGEKMMMIFLVNYPFKWI